MYANLVILNILKIFYKLKIFGTEMYVQDVFPRPVKKELIKISCVGFQVACFGDVLLHISV